MCVRIYKNICIVYHYFEICINDKKINIIVVPYSLSPYPINNHKPATCVII